MASAAMLLGCGRHRQVQLVEAHGAMLISSVPTSRGNAQLPHTTRLPLDQMARELGGVGGMAQLVRQLDDQKMAAEGHAAVGHEGGQWWKAAGQALLADQATSESSSWKGS